MPPVGRGKFGARSRILEDRSANSRVGKKGRRTADGIGTSPSLQNPVTVSMAGGGSSFSLRNTFKKSNPLVVRAEDLLLQVPRQAKKAPYFLDRPLSLTEGNKTKGNPRQAQANPKAGESSPPKEIALTKISNKKIPRLSRKNSIHKTSLGKGVLKNARIRLATWTQGFISALKGGLRSYFRFRGHPMPFGLMAYIGPTLDLQIINRVKLNIHEALLKEAKDQARINPQTINIKVDVHIDFYTGELVIPTGMEGNVHNIRARGDLSKNQISLPKFMVEGLESLLQSSTSIEEQSVISGILDLQGKEIREPRALPQIIELGPQEIVDIGKAPTILSQKPTRPRGQPRAKTTQGYPISQEIPIPPVENPAKELNSILSLSAKSAWELTQIRDVPPLLKFVNPPIMVGGLILDLQGNLVGHAFRRTKFSTRGKVEAYYPQDGLKAEGTRVAVLITKDGSLVFYKGPSALNQKQTDALEALKRLPKNEEGVKEFREKYSPFYDWMGEKKGILPLLSQINHELARRKSQKVQDKYAIQVYLLKTDRGYALKHRMSLEEPFPEGAIAETYIEIQIRKSTMDYSGSEFNFLTVKGMLPTEVAKLLKWAKERVEEGKVSD